MKRNGKNPQIKLKAEILQSCSGTETLIGIQSSFDAIARGSPLKENNLNQAQVREARSRDPTDCSKHSLTKVKA